MSNFERLNGVEPFMAAIDEVRGERDEARAEVKRLRRQNALLGQALWKWEQCVGPENLPAIGAEATLAYDEALGRVR